MKYESCLTRKIGALIKRFIISCLDLEWSGGWPNFHIMSKTAASLRRQYICLLKIINNIKN